MIKIQVGIITISDRSSLGTRIDISGPALKQACENYNWHVVRTDLISDDMIGITSLLLQWSDDGLLDLILTTGGTGFTARDNTPEATLAVIEKNTPGLSEAMRQESRKITSHAMLSRGVCGIRRKTLIINLPGSPKGAVENLQIVSSVIPHAIELIRGEPQADENH